MVDLYRKMWFGTRERMTAIRAPRIDFDASSAGWSPGVTQLLNGGAYVRRSVASHKTYSMSWPRMSRDEVRLIADYADGVYGSGPCYFIDPFAMDKNLLPQYWATPRLVYSDAPVLTGQLRDSVRNTQLEVPNDLNYPTYGATYVDPGTSIPYAQRPKLFVPVPEGYTVWFGAHGQSYNNGSSIVRVKPANGEPVTIPLLGLNDSNRFSNSWDGSSLMTGVEVSLTAPSGSSTIHGMMLQILPTGMVPLSGGFISGQGNSGVRFAMPPTVQNYSAAMDMVGLSAQLVEDEAWR